MEEKYLKLANLMFPEVSETLEDLEIKYPKRESKGNITRFAPSPTGFLHTGALFTTLVDKLIANSNDGKYILRIEDTDKKREVEGSVKLFTEELSKFGLSPNEGVISEDSEIGEYGPYTQSKRKHIYDICAKYLVSKGLAYPCFCSKENIDKTRELQEKNKMVPGYYGVYAKCRNLSVDEYITKIENNESYIVRFRSNGNHLRKMSFVDGAKGKIEMAQNDQDTVIRKADGLPTYHFAHVCDDHFMRITHVVRGEEWLPSTPMHIEMFEAIGFEVPTYIHSPLIMVKDGDSKRKLSKRKDKEAAVKYFLQVGYPTQAVIEYLMTLVNSDFEMWRSANKDKNISEFVFKLNKMSSSGSLLDMDKVNDISKNYIATLSSIELFNNLINYSKEYNKVIYNILNKDIEYSKKILTIERDNAKKVRKDLSKYEDFLEYYNYFFSEKYEESIVNGYNFDENISKELVKEILTKYLSVYTEIGIKEDWFPKVKALAEEIGFATDMKAYKLNKDAYKGSVADIATIIRVAVTNKTNTPDLYEIMNVLGYETVNKRINNVINSI